jgi:hypothetical protein
MVSTLSAEAVRQDPFQVEAGSPHPLGATPSLSGVNFSLASSNATGVELFPFFVPGRRWCVAVDTAAFFPHDVADPGAEIDALVNPCRVEARSVVVLVNRS